MALESSLHTIKIFILENILMNFECKSAFIKNFNKTYDRVRNVDTWYLEAMERRHASSQNKPLYIIISRLLFRLIPPACTFLLLFFPLFIVVAQLQWKFMKFFPFFLILFFRLKHTRDSWDDIKHWDLHLLLNDSLFFITYASDT